MTPEQEAALVGGGDCRSHFHIDDRQPTQSFLQGLQGLQSVVYASASYTARLKDDFHLLTASSTLTVSLPVARGNRLITFVQVGGAGNCILAAASPDTVNGGASLTISSLYSPVRLLAIKGLGYIQV